MRSVDKHAAAMAHVGALFDLRPHHEPRRIAQRQNRQTVGIAQLHVMRRLVRAFCFNGSAQVLAVVGDHTEGPAFDAYQACDDAGAEFRPQFEE
ncbi:MAG: hypothetical protein A4E73_01132 [Syntrophaceae bacterium PtaU1.Bin231]|nr:MAG: hypothetical protein A4E73_01132 [Syntrophaceae bacterium PtaU1.Bin231]